MLPDQPFFPDFGIEQSRMAVDYHQPPLTDHGINDSLQNIGLLYQQLSLLKSRNPILGSKGGMKTESDFIFPSIEQALSPKMRTSDIEPVQFDPVQERLGRYQGSKYFRDIGFLPGRDNEELYGRAQTGWEAFTNGISGAWQLAKFQFVDQLKGWGRMVDSVFSGDLDKLYDQNDLEAVNSDLDDIMNKNPVFMTKNDRDKIFTWANVANVVQQSGFTLGAIAEIAAEELLLTALTASTGGAAAPVQGARSAALLATLKTAFRRLARAENAAMEPNRMRKVFNSLGRMTPFTNTLQTVAKGARAEENALQLASRGFGSFYRDIREANAAFTEARAETSGTYYELKNKLTEDLHNSGQPVTQQKLQEIDRVAREAADANFWANSLIIGASNRIQFDNIFRGFKGTGQYLREIGDVSVDKKGFFKRSAIPFTKGFLRTAKAEAIPKAARYFKNNITEALQENLQSASDQAVRSYYEANYNSPGSKALKDSIYESISSQFSTEGAKTFLSGFLTGAITNPFTRGIPALYDRVSTTKVQRDKRAKNIEKQLNVLNGFFSKAEGRNGAVQLQIGKEMGEAIKSGDIKSFADLKDESVRSFARAVLETGKVDLVFERMHSLAKGLTKEEFEQAFGIKYSDTNKQDSLRYIDALYTKVMDIKQIKDDLDYKFANPFMPEKTDTEEDAMKKGISYAKYEEAKWHIAYMKDAHMRTSKRQSSIIKDLQLEMPDMTYSAISKLTDIAKAKDEVKMLRQEASVINDVRLKEAKIKEADLLNALIPSIQKGDIDPETFREYVNLVQEKNNREPITDEFIDNNRTRLNDFIRLGEERQRYFDNLNWLADPANASDFFNRHIEFKIQEEHQKKQDDFADAVDDIGKDHPGYEIRMDENGNVKVEAKEGEGSEQETEAIKEELKAAEEKIFGKSPEDEVLERIKERLASIYRKLSDTGEISDQDREFLNSAEIKEIGENDANYRKIMAILERKPKEEEEGEKKKSADEKTETTENVTEDDTSAFPYYEGSDVNKENPLPKGAAKTIIEEVVDGGAKNNEGRYTGGKRDENGDAIMEGGYSFLRGQVARLFLNNPLLLEQYEFAIVRDSRLYYEHVSGMSEEVREKLQVSHKNSPYNFFIDLNRKSDTVVMVIRDRKTKELIYFNPYVPGMVTDSKNGLVAAFALANTSVRESILNYVKKQPKQELILDFSKYNPISPGSFFENENKLRDFSQFMEGIDAEEVRLHISRGLKQIPWNAEENTRNGGVFIKVGNLNKIKLLPSKLTEIKVAGATYDIRPFFERVFDEATAKEIATSMSLIIYRDAFQPKNAFYEKVIVSIEPRDGQYGLKLIRFVDSTPNEPDFKKKKFVDSGQNTATVLTYLLKGGRRINVDENIQQDINLPIITDAGVEFKTIPYMEFLSKNLFTNKARVVRPDGKLDIHPVNNFFVISGLNDILGIKPGVEEAAEKVAAKMIGEKPKAPVVSMSTLQENLWTKIEYVNEKGEVSQRTISDIEPKDGPVFTAHDSKHKSRRSFNILSITKILDFVKRPDDKKPPAKPQDTTPDTTTPTTDDLLKKLRDETKNIDKKKDDDKPKDDINPFLAKVKDELSRALIGNKELQFIKDRFGEHVLNHLAYAVNSDYWGYWKQGVITLYGDARRGVGYHEAWHHFSQMFLTRDEKISLYNELMSEKPELRGADLKQVEEYLADRFSEYAVTQEEKAPVRKTVFQKIWEFLRRIFGGSQTPNQTTLDKYFTDLYFGNLASYKPAINNALWANLNYGFNVTQEGKQVNIFDAQEDNVAKGLFKVLLYTAFTHDGPEHNLKAENISIARMLNLSENSADKKVIVNKVFRAVVFHLEQFIVNNRAELERNAPSRSILDRMLTNYEDFFNHVFEDFRLGVNIDELIEEEEVDVVDVTALKPEEAGLAEEDSEDVDAQKESQFSDKVLPFQDKGLLASVSKVMKSFVTTIPKAQVIYNNEGEIEDVVEYKNGYGFPEPADPHRILAILGEELAGVFSDQEMLEKLNSPELMQRLPEVVFLNRTLTGYGAEGQQYSVQTIMSLMRDFNRVFVPVYSVIEIGEGERIMVEKTKGTANKLRAIWKDNFMRSDSSIVVADPVTGAEKRILNPSFSVNNERLVKRVGDDERVILNRIEYLSKLGITLSDRTIKTKKFRDFILGYRFVRFAETLEGRQKLGQNITDPVADITRDYEYRRKGEDTIISAGEGAFIRELLRLESIYSDIVPSNVFVTAKGTKKYSLMLPNMFNVVGNELRKANSIRDISSTPHVSYLTDPENFYVNNSLVLKSLFNKEGLKRDMETMNFEFGDYNGIEFKIADKKINKQSSDLTGRDKIIANINSLLGFGIIDVMRTGSSESFYFYRVPKWFHSYELKRGEFLTTESTVNVPFSARLYSKGRPNSQFDLVLKGYFYNLLVDEVNTMRFSSVPGKDFSDSWGVFDDILKRDLKAKIKALEINSPADTRNALYEIIPELMENVREFFFTGRNSLTNRFLKYAKTFGIGPTDDGRPNTSFINPSIVQKYGSDWRGLVENFILNDFVINVEYSKLFTGIPQFYKDYHKRASGPMSPGNNANIGPIIADALERSHPMTMRGALGKPFDPNIHLYKTSTTTDEFTKLDEDVEEAYRRAGKVLGKVDEVEQAIKEYDQTKAKAKPINDGQAWVTLDFYRRFRIQAGNWDPLTDEIEYWKEVAKWRIKKGLYKSEEELKGLQSFLDKYPKTLSTFPIAKLQYNGPEKARGLMRPVFHKFAVAPIIPSAWENTPLEKMQDWMLEKDIDYVTSISGSKNYNKSPFSFWDENKSDFSMSLDPNQSTLFSVYLKEQIKTAREIKDKSTWGTQIKSLWMSNRFNDGKASEANQALFDTYKDDLEAIIEAEKNQLFTEFGIKEQGDRIVISNAKGFVETLRQQADLRGLNSNVKASIKFDEVTGTFDTPLEIITNRQSIVDMIGGMIFRKLVRISANGDMLIQMSSLGTRANGEPELAFYKPVFDKKGNFIRTQAAQTKISFNKHFYPLLRLPHADGKRIDTRERLNEMLKDPAWVNAHRQEVTIVAYRFPTEGPNSMEFMEVREFLPEVAGSIMVVPREIVIKVGSDFDHDKLNIFRPSYGDDGNVLGPDTIEIYETAVKRLIKIASANELVQGLMSKINALFSQEELESENDLDIDLEEASVSKEERLALKNYKKAMKDMKGYHMNQAMQAYIDSLSSPEMFLQLIKPNTTEKVKALAMQMAEKQGLEGFTETGVKAFTNTQIFDYTNNHIKFLQNVQGKNDLAVYAVLNKTLHNFQKIGVKLNSSFINKLAKKFYGTRNNLSLNTTPYLLTKEERDSFMQNGEIPLGFTEDIEGETITHIVAELMNSTVDIEKDAFYIALGINRYNKGVAAMLLAMRVPLKRISAFLLQPSLKEYYSRQESEPFAVINGQAFFASNINAKNMFNLKNRIELEREIQFRQNNDPGDIFSYDNLIENVGSRDWNNREQLTILAHFLMLQRLQRLYMMIQSNITVDTKKISTPLGANLFDFSKRELLSSGIINEEMFNKIRQQSYTSMFHSRDMIAKIFETLMPIGFSRTFIEKFSNRIVDAEAFLTKDQMLQLEKTVANDYMMYIVLEHGEYEGEPLREYLVKKLSRKLSQKTLMMELVELKKAEYPEIFELYDLTKRLKTNQSSKLSNLHNVEIQRGVDNTTETQEVLISEFIKLMNFRGNEIPGRQYSREDILKIRKFFRDLVVVMFGQSGFNKSILYATDILPISEINPITKRALQKYKERISANPEYESQFIDAFINEFVKENPKFDMQKSNVNLNQEPWRGKYLRKPVKLAKPAGPQRKFFITEEIVTREDVRNNIGTLYLFGDNVQRTGLGGQAKELRGEPNAFGIATKKRPANDTNAFFNDKQLEQNKAIITKDINGALEAFRKGAYEQMVVLPLGTGMAQLDKKAPLTFDWLQQELKRLEIEVNGGQLPPPDQTPPAAPPPTTPPTKGPEPGTPDNPIKIPMKFKDGDGGRKTRDEFRGKSMMDLVLAGFRTGTSRDVTKPYTKTDLKVGDIVEFYDDNGRKAKVVVTKAPYPITDISKEQWSLLEGWDESLYDSILKRGGKYEQFQFKLYSQIEPSTRGRETLLKLVTRDTPKNDPNSYVNHSGGAIGSDYDGWDKIGREFGVTNHIHYWMDEVTPYGNTEISKEDAVEGQKKVTIAARQMGRIEPTFQVRDKRLIRNWAQVKYSDAVFAVSTLLNAGDKMNYGKTAKIVQVKGGTGYAVQMAINEGKTVYVFDQVRKAWYENSAGTWTKMKEVPVLTPNFAGIGTREINEDGKNAIRAVYEKTFGTVQKPEVTVQVKPKEGGKINIYAGTGENPELSNFAVRPFRIDYGASYTIYDSVEQAFQAEKRNYSEDSSFNSDIEEEIMETTDGGKLKQLGKKFRKLDQKEWDANSSRIMKRFILESFKQNPEALAKLLATGNATLTHTQDKGKWGTEFPRLLMEVRDELREMEVKVDDDPFLSDDEIRAMGINVISSTDVDDVLREKDKGCES